jgi:hypothetical protein
MLVKKYKAIVTDNNIEVIGYLIEQRENIGNECYSGKKQYLIYVTEFSMPNSIIRGGFIVKKETIKEFFPCYVCGINEVKQEYFNSCCSDKCYKYL